MKAFIENNNIFITPEDNLVPQGAISIDVPEGTQLDELIWDGNELKLKDMTQVQHERLEKLKQQALDINLRKYKDFCIENDNDYIKYLKRNELSIEKDKDKADYEAALQAYKDMTAEYEANKNAIMNMTIEELGRWINENAQFNIIK